MSSGACAATLPVVSEPTYSHGTPFSKSLPVNTKTILRKFITHLTHGKVSQQQQEHLTISDPVKPRKEIHHRDKIDEVHRYSSQKVPIYPGNPKSRERTFDLLTLVPASPRSVMAPPPSPSVQLSSKRISKFSRISKPVNLDSEEEELGIDFFFGGESVEQIVKMSDKSDDDDCSSLEEVVDCDGEEQNDVFNEFFGQSENEIFEQNLEESFYEDQDMGDLVKITDCCHENEHSENEFTSELDFGRLAPPLQRQVSQSLGPNVTHLSDAFDLVRKFEFQAPWISDISPSQIDDILFDVGTPSEDDDVSFEIKTKQSSTFFYFLIRTNQGYVVFQKEGLVSAVSQNPEGCK